MSLDGASSAVSLLRGVGAAGWSLTVYDVVGSTNDLARELPAWSAVRAARQTAGRGRFGRSFVSDEGGLWLSAVLPGGGSPERWKGFSLMVGCHLLRLLKSMNLVDARLRWPNDLMIGSRKLGGLLIEQSGPGMLIVGLGLNVGNEPWQQDAALASVTTRLADLMNNIPDLDDLAAQVLDAIASAHEDMLQRGLAAAAEEFNVYREPVPVELTLTRGSPVEASFIGLDPQGNLRLRDASGHERVVEHQVVQRLRELA